MKLKSTITVLSVAALMAACNNRVSVSDTGLKYQIHDENDGRKPKIGDIMTFQLVLKNSRDSVLRDTYKEGRPMQMMLQVPPFKGSFEEGLAMLSKKDSASFFVNADSLFSKMMQPLPAGITKGSDITFTVKVLEVQNEQEFQKAQADSRAGQTKKEAKIIDDYVAKNKMTTIKTASGLNYMVVKEGTGVKPTAGNMVSVHYIGKLLDGKEFDSSYKNPQSGGKPVDFPIGQGMVIPGWEEGIMSMKKGGKSTFIIPSTLGYGEAGSPGAIPPNSVLVFEVELVDVKPGQPAPPAVGGREIEIYYLSAFISIMRGKSIWAVMVGLVFAIIACQQTEEVYQDRKTRENKIEIREYLTRNRLVADSLRSGLYYIIKNSNPSAQKLLTGDEITFRYVARRLDGTVVDSSQVGINDVYIRSSNAREIPIIAYSFVPVPAFEEILLPPLEKVREGDKITLLVPWSLRATGDVSLLAPLYIPIRYDIDIVKVRTEEEQIDDYIALNKIQGLERNPANGLRFVKTKSYPDSATIALNTTVSVVYTGRAVRNGNQFDAGTIDVNVVDPNGTASGGVVKGFNDGIAKLRYGEKAIVIFPSPLGYGIAGSGAKVSAYAPLSFEIEAKRK